LYPYPLQTHITNWLSRSKPCQFNPLIPKHVFRNTFQVNPPSLPTTYISSPILVLLVHLLLRLSNTCITIHYFLTGFDAYFDRSTPTFRRYLPLVLSAFKMEANVREILVLIYRGTLPDIPEVRYIDTAVRLSKPTFSGAFIQYFVCIFVFTVLDIRADRHITTFLTLEPGHI
jgi:hypothetical protein